MNKQEYPVVNQYVFFKELGTDALGVSHRVGEFSGESRKILRHNLATEVYPFLFSNPNVWKKVSILLEGVRKSNIPKLYSPEKIFQEGDKHYLIYPFIKGRTLEQVLEDSTQKENPVNFDLAVSLAFAIADLIDIGSSIVVSGEKSFHGFLTPDNIIVDFDGKIYLKNYGIYPYLSREEVVFTEMVKKYGAWVAPEFFRREKLASQTDIYHLGYVIYRILTGKYYSYSPEEDFDSKFSNISFIQHIPSGDTEFLTNIITFFKKTLHPLPSQRFANIKEFKDHISNNFHIEELSSVTFSLAYFMNSLYLEPIEEDTKILEEELTYQVPEPKKEVVPKASSVDDELVEDILTGLEKGKKSRMKLLVPLIALIVVIVGISTFVIISQQQQARKQLEAQRQTDAENKLRMEKFKMDLETEYQKRLKAIEDTAVTTQEEKKAQEDEIKALKEWQKEETRKALEKQKLETERLKKEEDEKKKKETEIEQQKALAEQKKQAEEQQRKKQEEEATRQLQEEEKTRQQVKEGDLVGITEVTEKPAKLKDKEPIFTPIQQRKYRGSQMSVRALLLIDEKGNVVDVKMIGDTPEDIKAPVEKALRKWTYKPAKKNNVKVKVWYTVAIKVAF